MRFGAWFLTAVMAACTPATVEDESRSQATGPLPTLGPRCTEHLLPWGSAPGHVGLVPGGEERKARGAPALAVTLLGDLLVLDAVNERVLSIGRHGDARVLATVARDAEDLATGADGSFVAFSPLRSTAWVFNHDGAPAGELHLPRALRHITGLSVGPSRRLRFHNSYQDTFLAGSPSLPTPEPALLRSKKEGAFLLPDGRGVQVRAHDDGTGELTLVDNKPARTATRPVDARHVVPGPVTALRLAGTADGIACMRVEELVAPAASRVTVRRRVVCMELLSGRVSMDEAMPPPGIYLPRHEIAVGGTPARVAWQIPTDDGLHITSCEVTR